MIDFRQENKRVHKTTLMICIMKYGTVLVCAYMLTAVANRVVDTMAFTYLKAHATCPGPLAAGDYHTPEEDSP